jgi:hypothetical protein
MSGSDSVDTSSVRSVLEDFLDTLAATVNDIHKIERVLAGDETLTIKDLSNQPEEWTEGNLIWPLIEAVGLNREPGRPASQRSAAGTTQREAPDFRLVEDEGELVVIGENKSPNKIELAEQELVEDYLSNKAWPDYGIATDGFEWVVYRAEHGGDFLEFNEVERVNLRPALNAIARNLGHLGSGSLGEVDVEESLSEFVSTFTPDNLHTLLTQTAPKEFRDARNANVEEFYELYIELLFGESDEHDYDTCLRNDIVAPSGATDKEQDLFAVSLMNRLLFIKFLETRDVLSDGFLRTLVREYNESSVPGTLYEAFVKPLFYDLFNTPQNERHPKLRTGRYADVPYLNGGLFRENIPNETEYNLLDRTLPTIIEDLIEGHRLELNGQSFDPAILGSVFEKTINHIGGEEGRQKEIGAYYTPNDVTRHISEHTVDPKVKDILVEAFVENSADGNEQYIRNEIQDTDLSEILRYIEDGTAMYGANPEALEDTLDRLNDLTILDPACGSGHFLTTAMEELHQAQLSILRGLDGGDEPSREERYEAKQELALNAIYGVDVDEVAVEIAKLRVWLKIVEGNGWDEEFGRLPNIDVNIVSGNSLVGFPVRGDVQTQMGAVDERLSDLAEKRRAYKFENEGSRRDIMTLEEEVREDRDEKFLQHLTYTVDTEITSVDEFNALVESIREGGFYPTVQSVKVQRLDDDGDTIALTDDDKDTLSNAGFEWQEWRNTNKSASLDIEARIKSTNSARGELEEQEAIIEDLRGVLDEGFVFPEVERQPTRYDLEHINGTPLHWDIEFPELLPLEETNGMDPNISFDIVIGNPPYGNILNGSEKTFTAPFLTGSINDVSAPFVERQLQITDENGYFGNITTLRLIYQSSLGEFHELLQNNLEPAEVACFGFRPSRVFENAHVRVAIITGAKAEDSEKDIHTSDLILFNGDNRQERFNNINYGSAEGLYLRDSIGGEGSNGPVLPKVGGDIKRDILTTLRSRSNTVLRDKYLRDEPGGEGYVLYKRRGVLYWTNPMLEELYSSTLVDPVWYESKLQRDISFLIISSSLYVLYWYTYGNQHTHEWLQMGAFPFPDKEKVEAHSEEIEELAEILWERMKGTFSKSRENRGDFFMSTLRPIIDDIDALMGELYDLTDEQVKYTQNYLTDLGENSGRAGKGDEDLTYDPIVVDD